MGDAAINYGIFRLTGFADDKVWAAFRRKYQAEMNKPEASRVVA